MNVFVNSVVLQHTPRDLPKNRRTINRQIDIK